MNRKIVGEIDVAGEAIEDLQSNAFKSAQRVVEVAKFILAGEAPEPPELFVEAAPQATSEPSSETVQKPASE